MGKWESMRCSECGALIPEPTTKHSRTFYKIGGAILCPSCWVAPRIAPGVSTIEQDRNPRKD